MRLKILKIRKKNLPKAFYSSILIVIVLYVLIALITVGTVPESQLLMAKDYALAVADKPALGQFGLILFLLLRYWQRSLPLMQRFTVMHVWVISLQKKVGCLKYSIRKGETYQKWVSLLRQFSV